MKKLLFLLVVVKIMSCTQVVVYVCDSKNAMKYHFNENCRGLKSCQHHIVKTTLSAARSSNKTLCQWERKQRENR